MAAESEDGRKMMLDYWLLTPMSEDRSSISEREVEEGLVRPIAVTRAVILVPGRSKQLFLTLSSLIC